MFARIVSAGLFAAAVIACAGCGDDADVSGAAEADAADDAAIAADGLAAVDTVADVATDAAADVTAAAPATQCEACETTADCAPAFDCVALLNGSFCIGRCTSVLDCSSKFTCDVAASTDASKHCLPPKYACEGCVVSGCPIDQVCDVPTGKCVVGKAPCTPCQSLSDCGPGLKCAALASPDFSTQKICMPDCSANASCPAGSLCQKTDAGTACGFTGLACCYGPSCKPDAGCATCPDKCILGACVACLVDSSCPGGHCDTTSHACVNVAGCPPDKPIKLADGSCGQCAATSDCGKLQICDKAAHACIADPITCQACNAPYPDCVQINATWSCVQCSSDATCAAQKLGTCSTQTFTCSGNSGGGDPITGGCKQASDCQNLGTAFDLACDATGTGLCYDKAGKCDNISAFCNVAKGCSCVAAGTGTLGTCSCGF